MFFRNESFGNGPLRFCDMAKRGTLAQQLENYILPQIHDEPIGIDKKKYDDLQEQLRFIPPCHHEIYSSLSIKKSNE